MIEFTQYNAAVEYLIEKGFKKSQAEAIITSQEHNKVNDLKNLVTKDYLDAKLEARISQAETRIFLTICGWAIAIILTVFFK